MNPSDFKVGQQIFTEWRNRSKPYAQMETVSKVGRKWVEFMNGQYRFDPETMIIDSGGYTSPGRVWLTEDDYKNHVLRHHVWQELYKLASRYIPPDHLSIEQMNLIIHVLKGEKS